MSSQERKAINAGVWYTLCNTVISGISFLTIPVFARLLSPEDFGAFSNFTAWLSLLTILTTLNFYVTVARAKFDFSDKLDSYISSVQVLGTICTAACYMLVVLFQDFFTKLFSLDMVYIHIIFIYLLVYPSFQLLQAKHRQFMQYKSFVALTALSVLSSVACSLLLVTTIDNQLMGRIVGYVAPLFFICLAVYIFNIIKGKSFANLSYWGYALPIAIPLIPHVLSGNILGTSDQAIITFFCGSEQTAFYSIAYSCSLVVMMLGNSINQAWTPWLYEKLNTKEYSLINRATKIYLVLALASIALLMMFSPEIVLLMGGDSYREVSNIMPPIMLGCFFWCLYTHFVNIEIFEKKTFGISIRTLIAALLNLVLNVLLVPVFGYVAAAYTTLLGYVLLFFMHALSAKKLGAAKYYNYKFFFKISCLSVGVMCLFLFVNKFFFVRVALTLSVVFILALCLLVKRKAVSYYIKKSSCFGNNKRRHR